MENVFYKDDPRIDVVQHNVFVCCSAAWKNALPSTFLSRATYNMPMSIRGKCPVCSVACDKSCKGCLSVAYCSVEHQRKDWARHKSECKALRAAAIGAAAAAGNADVRDEDAPRAAVTASALFDMDVDVPPITSVNHTNNSKCMSCGEAAPTVIVSGQPLAAVEDPDLVIWALFCDSCADAQELRYYYPRGKRMYFVSEDTEKTKFPAEVEGVTVCPHCSASDLVLVYDEVNDEFLACNRCRQMRQQLRVWNKFQDVLLDEVKPPVVLSKEYLELEAKKQELFAENRRRVVNGQDMLPVPDWAK